MQKLEIKGGRKISGTIVISGSKNATLPILASTILTNKKITLKPNTTLLIPTGFSIQLPKGFEAQVRPRSGLALKNSITVLNTPGTIDADYRGEVCVILINHGKKKFDILRGMRIAQIIFMELPKIKLEKKNRLSNTKRGEGGFGSTGT